MKKSRPFGQIFLTALTTALLSSCAIYAPDERTDLNRGIPATFTLYSDQEYNTTNRWWENFQSPELDAFVTEALTNNPGIESAWARLAQAEALARIAGAGRSPTLGYYGNAGGTWTEGSSSPVESYSAGLSAAYEVDLWGQVKSTAEARNLDRAATEEQLKTTAITLSARVAQTWTGLVAQRLQTEVIRLQLEANLTSLELIELRFRKSQSTALDVYQQRQTVAATESLIPQAELNENLLFNELAVLLGRPDFQSLEVTQAALPAPGKLPALGIPAEVLANRPDVREAGLRLYAADWQVSAARADRLPSLSLTGTLDYSSSDIADLFDDWAANLAASLTGPIFDGGRRKAEVDRQRAIAQERIATYRETVLNAMKEVEDALVSEQKQHEYIEKLDARLEAARRSYEESINRYRNGLIEYTTVLIQLNTLQNLERDRIAAQYTLLQYRIDLYRSLGGSWPNELPTPSYNNED